MYEAGRGGLAKDDKEAVRLYKLTADQGHAVAQHNLGWMYEQGKGGLAKDENEDFLFYRSNAKRGFEWAKGRVAALDKVLQGSTNAK